MNKTRKVCFKEEASLERSAQQQAQDNKKFLFTSQTGNRDWCFTEGGPDTVDEGPSNPQDSLWFFFFLPHHKVV